jgi:hypothetical protein
MKTDLFRLSTLNHYDFILTNIRSRINPRSPVGIVQGEIITAASSSVLTQPLLDRCRERAPGYDRDNTFCLEDFNELKAAGYLKMAIPKEFGRQGMTHSTAK